MRLLLSRVAGAGIQPALQDFIINKSAQRCPSRLPPLLHSARQGDIGCRRPHMCQSLDREYSVDAAASVQTIKSVDPKAEEILKYWLGTDYRSHPPNFYDTAMSKLWFAGGSAVDEVVKERFGDVVEEAAGGGLQHWRHGYEALAGVIVRDQFTRNIHRGTPKMFSLDQQALSLAKSLVESGEAQQIIAPHRVWLYMPYMHSEALPDQQECVRLFRELEEECRQLPGGGEPMAARAADSVRFAAAHEAVIRRWGRFPHRNALLGRDSTPDEAAGLQEGTIPRF